MGIRFVSPNEKGYTPVSNQLFFLIMISHEQQAIGALRWTTYPFITVDLHLSAYPILAALSIHPAEYSLQVDGLRHRQIGGMIDAVCVCFQ